MTNDEKADGLDAIIQDLVEWELKQESQSDLENFFFTKMVFYYTDNPKALDDMLKYRKEIEDTDTVLYWDTDKKDVQPITTRKPSWVDQE